MDPGLGKSIYFFYKALLFGVATLVTIPREVYKKYLIWGFILGGVGELAMVTIFERLLHLIKYKNMGFFNVFGLVSFWTPLAWMFTFMLFFYFLPVRRIFFYLYLLGFAFFAHMVGLVLQNLGLFEYIGTYIYYAPLVFFLWFSLAAFTYLRYNRITLK